MTSILPPAVVLVRPQEQGNVGAVARAMANLGLDRLILVEPAVALGATARAFAVKAGPILERAERVASLADAVAPFARVVGTSSGRKRRTAAPPLTARQLAARWAATPEVPTALVFGPEASGLTGDELALCGELVTIPCATRQPTLNLGQAVLIVAYELWTARPDEPATSAEAPGPDPDRPAPAGAIDGLFAQLTEVLAGVGFARDNTFDGVVRDLRRLAARSAMSEREVAILRGICRRTQGTLDRLRQG